MTKVTPINGWTKEKMIEAVMARVPEDGCYKMVPKDGKDGGELSPCCMYRFGDKDGPACAVGAFIPDDLAVQIEEYITKENTSGKGMDIKALSWYFKNLHDILPISIYSASKGGPEDPDAITMLKLQHSHDLAVFDIWNAKAFPKYSFPPVEELPKPRQAVLNWIEEHIA